MAQKKKKTLKRPARTGDRDLHSALKRVRELMERRQMSEARRLVDRLIDDHPERPEVYRVVADIAFVLREHHLALFACERLQELAPRDPELPLIFSMAYLTTGLVALAVTTGRRALATNRGSLRAEVVRQLIARFEPDLANLAAAHGLAGADGLECVVMHEQVQALVGLGKFAEAQVAAERLIARQPRFAPAYNNCADACYHDGKIAAAIAMTERVLAFAPDNVYALSNLVCFLVASSRMAEARQHAERLKQLQTTTPQWTSKQAVAFTWIGDDDGVLAACAAAQRPELGNDVHDEALLHHLAAVAKLHQGDERAARAHWQAALHAMPGFALAQANLDDLKQPIGKRHAPWVVDLATIVPKKLIGSLIARMQSARGGDGERAAVVAAKAYVAAHPEVEGLVPLLLNLTEASGRELAIRLATLVRSAAMLEAVRAFAVSQRGPDAMRVQAATLANEAGLLPDSPVQMWVNGEWRAVGIQTFEIHTDPVERNHAPGVLALIAEGVAAMNAGNVVGAEAVLRRALAIDPDDPVVMNNLAAALAKLGRLAETTAISERLVERHPDYLFGRTALAGMAAVRGEVARGRELLAPLLERRRFHRDEYSALCMAQVNLFLADNNREQARVCLNAWREVDPQHPALAGFMKILGP